MRTRDPVVTRAELLANGVSDSQIRQARRRGALIPIVPGVYLRREWADDLDPREWQLAAVRVILSRLTGSAVASHLTAALVHRLGASDLAGARVHVIRAGDGRSCGGTAFVAHQARLAPDEVVRVDDLPVTTVARTVVDCACLLPFEQGLILTRQALRTQQVGAGELHDQVSRLSRVPGLLTARSVLAAANVN